MGGYLMVGVIARVPRHGSKKYDVETKPLLLRFRKYRRLNQ